MSDLEDDPAELFAKGSAHLIYIDADNCSYCDKFNRTFFRSFKKSELATKIYFTRINTLYFEDTDRDKDWPEYVQWVRDRTNVRKGAPRFIVMSGRLVVGNHYGLNAWKQTVVPKLAQLAGVDLKGAKPKTKPKSSNGKQETDK